MPSTKRTSTTTGMMTIMSAPWDNTWNLVDNGKRKVIPAMCLSLHYIDQLVSRGKRVILPVVLDDTNMELREYSGVQDLKEGAYHILEPKGKIYPEEKYPEIELAVIPGMSFDMKGNRLGRGKGYYDRFLTKIPHAYKIGICFDFQKIKEEGLLPVTPTDICLDEII